jgi:hypothetical protein
MEQRLAAEGARVVYFSTCSFSGKPSIEDFGNALGTAIRNLNSPQAHVVSHSLGGLVVRSYLAGKQSSGAVYTPPLDPKVRKWASIATPNFGALLPQGIPFLPDVQARELVPGNPFLFDLATWNQNRDDLRGVDTIAIIGNAGGFGPGQGSNEGTVGITSASLSFAEADERTRALPSCHGAGDLTSILGLGCDGPPLAVIRADSPLSWQIIDSFLAGRDDWKTAGRSPGQDPYGSLNGGVLQQQRDRFDTPQGSPSDQAFVTNPPVRGGYAVVINKPGPRMLLAIPSAARLDSLSLAPRMLISIYGTALAGCVVAMNGRTLALNYADDRQINALLPEDVTGIARLSVSNTNGSQTFNIMIEPAAPAIFTAVGSGAGAATAIREGTHLSLYLTGLGRGVELANGVVQRTERSGDLRRARAGIQGAGPDQPRAADGKRGGNRCGRRWPAREQCGDNSGALRVIAATPSASSRNHAGECGLPRKECPSRPERLRRHRSIEGACALGGLPGPDLR